MHPRRQTWPRAFAGFSRRWRMALPVPAICPTAPMRWHAAGNGPTGLDDGEWSSRGMLSFRGATEERDARPPQFFILHGWIVLAVTPQPTANQLHRGDRPPLRWSRRATGTFSSGLAHGISCCLRTASDLSDSHKSPNMTLPSRSIRSAYQAASSWVFK